MQKENKKLTHLQRATLSALRSGYYSQARGRLRTIFKENTNGSIIHSFCALGVLADVYVTHAPKGCKKIAWDAEGAERAIQPFS